MQQVRAVIFDMDGVLIDSEPLWQRAEIAVFAEVGVELTERLCRQTTGLRIDEVVEYWRLRQPWHGPSNADVAHKIRAAVCALILAEGQALPGATAAPRRVVELGLKCGLASSSPPEIIAAVIERLGLEGCFEVALSAESQPLGKPHPAVYLAAAAALEVPARQCLAIEDSINGMVSAVAARMPTVVVPEPAFRDDPRYKLADWQLETLLDLPELLRLRA